MWWEWFVLYNLIVRIAFDPAETPEQTDYVRKDLERWVATGGMTQVGNDERHVHPIISVDPAFMVWLAVV